MLIHIEHELLAGSIHHTNDLVSQLTRYKLYGKCMVGARTRDCKCPNPPETLRGLIQAAVEEWDLIPHEMIDSLICKMPHLGKQVGGLPPTKVNRVRYPVESLLDVCTWESYRKMPLVGGFSRGSPVSSSLDLGDLPVSGHLFPERKQLDNGCTAAYTKLHVHRKAEGDVATYLVMGNLGQHGARHSSHILRQDFRGSQIVPKIDFPVISARWQ
ncbi:hypothetical protein PR048_008113 [Dryococelus australis]|uniref:Uncharacterized protein n=1 Tax=Dryococelus australis TaxID=614101 RepID=A0ABQ9HWZ3_9NEOP|nr:hypothetical protein PR048_008113 [Dryococelus australis]